jgi:SAM-dependent methyltransferase
MNPISAKDRASKRILDSLASGEYEVEDVPTCLCGSADGVAVAHEDRSGLPFGITLCRTCGLLRTQPRMAGGCLPQFYERDYHELILGDGYSASRDLIGAEQGAKIYELVKPYLPLHKRIRVLDIGCANGGVLTQFAEKSALDGREVEAFGSEYCPELAEEARSRHIRMLDGSIAEIAAAVQDVDVVILSHVLEHIVDIGEFLSHIHSLLSAGGLLYIELPGILAQHLEWRRVYGLSFKKYFTFAHVWHFSLSTLRDRLPDEDWTCLKGDEYIHSVFRRGPGKERERMGEGKEPKRVLRYLKWLRGRYELATIRRHHPSFLKRSVATALHSVGLYRPLYRWLRGPPAWEGKEDGY